MMASGCSTSPSTGQLLEELRHCLHHSCTWLSTIDVNTYSSILALPLSVQTPIFTLDLSFPCGLSYLYCEPVEFSITSSSCSCPEQAYIRIVILDISPIFGMPSRLIHREQSFRVLPRATLKSLHIQRLGASLYEHTSFARFKIVNVITPQLCKQFSPCTPSFRFSYQRSGTCDY